jgi:hypothetical protein
MTVDPITAALLERARGYRPTPEEIRAQRIAYVMGEAGCTRDEAEAAIRKIEGETAHE